MTKLGMVHRKTFKPMWSGLLYKGIAMRRLLCYSHLELELALQHGVDNELQWPNASPKLARFFSLQQSRHPPHLEPQAPSR
mmetsp:Transcript_25368/g.48557  ORF Transcript_25368/g.48557 Transcript_25368/m.48557 type:complete len:81 (+) Transcript_25368:317-559(+)